MPVDRLDPRNLQARLTRPNEAVPHREGEFLSDPALQYGNAVTADFVAAMNTGADTTLDAFFDQWVYGHGYPVYEWAAWQGPAAYSR